MQRYPVFVSLEGFSVLVAGAGTVGRRKIASLAEAGAGTVLVLDPGLEDSRKAELEQYPGVYVERRAACPEDVTGKLLVFAATNDADENARIAAMCAAANVLCNVADSPETGTFHVPALANAGGIAAAISTGGHSPALARRIRRDAEQWLSANYEPLLRFMAGLRPLVLGLGRPTEDNTAVFRAVVYSGLGEALSRNDMEEARTVAASVLPETLHRHIEDLLHGAG